MRFRQYHKEQLAYSTRQPHPINCYAFQPIGPSAIQRVWWKTQVMALLHLVLAPLIQSYRPLFGPIVQLLRNGTALRGSVKFSMWFHCDDIWLKNRSTVLLNWLFDTVSVQVTSIFKHIVRSIECFEKIDSRLVTSLVVKFGNFNKFVQNDIIVVECIFEYVFNEVF